VRRFHDLEAAVTSGIDPTRAINDIVWQHPAFSLKALSNRRNILEVLDDHEQHDGRIADPIRLLYTLRQGMRSPHQICT
jgi:hypothetical protein